MNKQRCRLGHFIAGLGLVMASLSATADFSADITVKLLAPGGTTEDATPVSLTQTVAVADLASGVLAGNLGGTGDISGFMLDDERVSFAGNTILLRLAAGGEAGGQLTTGYLADGLDPARYEISGLAVPGHLITGYTVQAFDGFANSGSSGLLAPVVPAALVFLFNNDTISFNLDSIVFVPRFAGQTENYAEFRIDLLTTPVPEPQPAWLLLAGGALLLLRRRAS
ncbi:PEP-CTERM sorting domain-containing protein [Roseateles sp. LYH14W]|uniref:PEP-CTERM sorting domain-containing protein n=1 Tax=Pelomonas parva TaxID=3299032 RepID=A0ABW7F2H4_9BURK